MLDGSGPASLEAPPLDAYPEIVWEAGPSARRVNLDTLTPEEVQSWKPGETVLLNGKMLTGRDAAHKRMVEMLNKGETLPVDLKGRFIYYVEHGGKATQALGADAQLVDLLEQLQAHLFDTVGRAAFLVLRG